MAPIPWKYIHNWQCNGCGICCKEYNIVLSFEEWLKLVRNYGINVAVAGLNKLYLNKKRDGTCVFLFNSLGRWYCGLQNNKPMACRLWPFKILNRPKYGKAKDAIFNCRNKIFFIYLDPFCPKLTWGKPSPRMTLNTIPEFIEIALGIRKKQHYSTSWSI